MRVTPLAADGQIELRVIGAGPAYTDRPGSLGACYLLRSGEGAIVLDIGQGSFPSLASTIEPSAVRAIVVSHLHPDHFIDLVPLRHYLCYEFAPSRRVAVLAPAGIERRLDALHDEPGFAAAALDITDLRKGVHDAGPFQVEAARVTHTTDSHAFRVTLAAGEPGIVYSGDCGEADDLRPLIRPGDWLLSEVSFGPGPVPVGAMHLDGPSIGRLAASTRPARVLLTHLQMGYDPGDTLASVRAEYNGPLQLVAPGDRFVM